MDNCEKEARFEAVYQALSKDVYAYFNVCFGLPLAEDLTQDVFLRVWHAIDKEKEPDIWRAWVFRCAVNLKNDALRQKYAQRNTQSFGEYAGHLAMEDTETFSISVQKAFQALPQKERELLTLKSFGFKSEEIADFQESKSSTVRTRLQKAKKHFKSALKKEGVTDVFD